MGTFKMKPFTLNQETGKVLKVEWTVGWTLGGRFPKNGHGRWTGWSRKVVKI